jgi:hypothetical protein
VWKGDVFVKPLRFRAHFLAAGNVFDSLKAPRLTVSFGILTTAKRGLFHNFFPKHIHIRITL